MPETAPDPKVAQDQQLSAMKQRRGAEATLKKEAAAKKGTLHRVAAGKSITCARGVIGPDEPVTARDFCKRDDEVEQGKEQLAHLLDLGYITAPKKAAKKADESKK